MGEIIFDKSKKNLKKVWNRINGHRNVSNYTNSKEVLFLAIGGYNRTFELLLAMGLNKGDISVHSNLTLSNNFLKETHMKKVILIKKLNYVTSMNRGASYSKRFLSIDVADAFEESMMIYKNANRTVFNNKSEENWVKPDVVVLDDPSLNLQFDGHRFYYQNDIGFVQIRNRNADPYQIIQEIVDVEEADKMMFARYQDRGADESEILDALNRLRMAVHRNSNNKWFMKPTEFKKVVGSTELSNVLKDIEELGIKQLSSNKRIGKENARWIVIPEQAFEFKGFNYKDDSELFEEEIQSEMEAERQAELKQEALLNSIMLEELPLNLKIGYVGNNMAHSPNETLQSFLDGVDETESDEIHGIELLDGASTEEEYKHIKKYNLAYFLDGNFKDNIRDNNHYIDGKRLIAIDIDEGDYSREMIESKLESQGLFGMVYPTAKYYFNRSSRWRIVMMADKEMTVETYRKTIIGVGNMLDLEIDASSEKIAQLMGYPLKQEDISIVIGTMVNVEQFNKKPKPNKVINFDRSDKSIVDFEHSQAYLLKEALTTGIPEGRRNDSYRQIIMFLRDIQKNDQFNQWHEEAYKLEQDVIQQMATDGLQRSEIEVICREV